MKQQQATTGLNLLRPTISLLPDNAILLQFLATLNNVIFLVETYKRRIQTAVAPLLAADVTTEEIQDNAEELAGILGVVLEAKIAVTRVITRLEELP